MALDFKAKLGPLPVWGWGLIGGGVIIVGYYMMNRGGGSADDSATVQYTDATGYRTTGDTKGTADSAETVVDSNAMWLTRASRQTAALVGKPVTDVYNALMKFLSGSTLTAEERKYVDTATANTGLPPEGVEAISPVQPTPGATTPKRYPATNTQWIVTTSAQAKKYLYDSTKGRITNASGIDPVTWAALRAAYGNNIDVRIVPAASIKKWGGK